jgi:DNA-binding LacI/PurR family transcriptional regulator
VIDYFKKGHRPTALLVHNDNAAFGVFKALREAGLSVPEDISLVGCDNVSLAQYAPVPLTTIDLRIRDVAHMAGQIMAEVLDENHGGPNRPYKQIRLSSRVVVRESTARAPRI